MTEVFKPGDKVKYKEAERYAAKGNHHDSDKVYTVAQSNSSITTFEESPLFCCTYRLEKVEEKMKKHKHYDLIVKWAANPDGYTVYGRAYDESEWGAITTPMWREDLEYKLVPKLKVKKWKWVYKGGSGLLHVTDRWYTKEGFEEEYPNLILVQKIDSTMIEE